MEDSGDFRAQRFLRITAVVVGFIAYWRLFFESPSWDPKLFTAWFFFPEDPFPQIIFLIAAALVYRRRESLRRAMCFQGSLVLGALPLLAGLSLFIWGHYVDATDLLLISFLLVSIGVGLLWFGVHFARALLIPWVVLAFAYTTPAVVLNQAFYALRLWTAAHTAALMQLAGLPVLREGNVILGSDMIAHVIDSCSGLRSIQILTLAAIFYAGWFPARRLRQVLLVILAPAIAYLFNLIRVGVIALWPTSEFSTAHTLQGLMVFFGAISCLVVVDRILGYALPGDPKNDSASRPREVGADSEPELQSEAGREPLAETEPEGADAEPETVEADPEITEAKSDEAPSPQGLARVKGRLGAASFVVLAVAMLGASIWMPRWNAPKSDRFVPAELPAELGGWAKAHTESVDSLYLWTVRFAKTDYWIYERDGGEISVFIGYDDRKNRKRSLLSRKNSVPRRGWEIEERSFVSLESVDARVERVVARSLSVRVLAYNWYEGTEDLPWEILRALLATDQSPYRRSQPARVIRVAAALGPTPDAQIEDEAKLREFASSLAAALRE